MTKSKRLVTFFNNIINKAPIVRGLLNRISGNVVQSGHHGTAIWQHSDVSWSWERDVPLWYERSLMVRWVVGSILHGGPIELILVPASAPRLV